jgi:hypothetical protein
MARQVTITKTNTTLPNGISYPIGAVVVLTDQQWNMINPGMVTRGNLTDGGNIPTTSP